TLDPLVSLLTAGLMLFSSWKLVREAVDVLMEAVPSPVDVDRLERALAAVPGVEEVHDLHVWTLTTGRHALSAHVVASGPVSDDTLLAALSDVCRGDFQVEHTTIQVEHENQRLREPAACAHRQPRAGWGAFLLSVGACCTPETPRRRCARSRTRRTSDSRSRRPRWRRSSRARRSASLRPSWTSTASRRASAARWRCRRWTARPCCTIS